MVTLIPASTADIPALWALRTRALQSQCASHYESATLQAWAAAPAPASYAGLLAQGGGIKALVDGSLAGYAILDLPGNEIDAVFVDPQFGGRGVGKALLQALEKLAQCPQSLHLYASLNAVPFYEAAGYRQNKKTQYQHPAGILLDCVWMTRD